MGVCVKKAKPCAALPRDVDLLSGEGDLRGEVTVGCTFPEGSPICLNAVARGTLLHPPLDGWGFGSYARAKLANVLFARGLPHFFGLAAASVHPGEMVC